MLTPNISTYDIQEELQSLLGFPEFRRNKNASAFLKFVVDETVSGRGDRLKAFTIATLALQRGADFDPQTNSIVRVQATRVRQMLESYYAGAGCYRCVQIVLPRGSYMPAFVRRDILQDTPVSPSLLSDNAQQSRHFMGLMGLMLIVGVLLGALVVGPFFAVPAVVRQLDPIPDGRAMPVLQVETIRNRQQDNEQVPIFLEGLASTLRHQLSAFDHLTVIPLEGIGQQSNYVLSLSDFGHQEHGEGFGFQLIHRASGTIVWTMTLQDIAMQDPGRVLKRVSSEIVAEIGDVYGVIFSDWARRTAVPGSPLMGAGCTIEAFNFLRTRLGTQRTAARACLERELVADPEDASSQSLLAMILLRGYADNLPDNKGTADLQRALQLARQAYDRAPHRARAQFTLFFARFFDRRYEDAFVMVQQALASNPNSSLIRIVAGSAYISRGQYEEGLRLLKPENVNESAAPGQYSAYIALAEYMKGEGDQFDRWAMRQSGLVSPLGLLMRILALEARQDHPGEVLIWRRLQTEHPGFAADIRSSLIRYGMTDEIVSRLDADLVRILAREGI